MNDEVYQCSCSNVQLLSAADSQILLSTLMVEIQTTTSTYPSATVIQSYNLHLEISQFQASFFPNDLFYDFFYVSENLGKLAALPALPSILLTIDYSPDIYFQPCRIQNRPWIDHTISELDSQFQITVDTVGPIASIPMCLRASKRNAKRNKKQPSNQQKSTTNKFYFCTSFKVCIAIVWTNVCKAHFYLLHSTGTQQSFYSITAVCTTDQSKNLKNSFIYKYFF